MTPMKQHYANLAATVIKGLEKRNMEGYYFETAQEAVDKIMSVMPEGSVVAFGGSQTLYQTGMMDALKHSNQNRNWTPEDKLVLINQYKAGASILSVSIEAGISDSLLYSL